MIVYGSKAVELGTFPSSGTSCPNCDAQDSLNITVFRTHAHVFWIPLFPVGKSAVAECQNCQHVMKKKQMSEGLRAESKMLKGESKGPVWQFAGSVLVLALIGWGVYTDGQNSKQELRYIAAPQVGDVYEYKTDNGNYSTLRIDEIEGDTAYISENDYETDKMSGIRSIDVEENYPEDLYGYSVKELQELYEDGTIYDINRD